MTNNTIGDDPRNREILLELRNLIEVNKSTSWSKAESREIIESLRVGIPPHSAVVTLTVGREELLARISHDLEEIKYNKSRFIILKGEYGIGKTHILRVLCEFAHQLSFASTHIELSLRECPLSDLGLVYRKIIKNLETTSHRTGFALSELLEEWASNMRSIGTSDRKTALNQLRKLNRDYQAALYAYFESKARARTYISSIVLHWIAGEELSKRERDVIKVSENISQKNAIQMLGNLGTLLRCMGLTGLVIMLDEAERTLSFESGKSRDNAIRNLNVLMRASKVFPHSFFAYSTPPSFFQQHEILRSLNLKTSDVIELDSLETVHLRQLAIIIRDVHLTAYEWNNQNRVCDSEFGCIVEYILENDILRSSVRGFVRAIVEILDCFQQDDGMDLSKSKKHLTYLIA